MLKIDAFTHLFPMKFVERLQEIVPDKGVIKRWLNVPMLWNVEARLRMIDSFPDYQQIISNAQPPIEVLASVEDSPDLARIANDGFADLCRRYPGHFPAFVASLPMNNPAAAVAEIDRVVEMGARGVQLFASVNGKPLDRPEFYPVFERMAHHDLPIWLHPSRGPKVPDFSAEQKSHYEIWLVLGWPFETSAAMAHLVFSGIFDKLPHLKIIAHHMGAMIPFFEGRVGPGWDQLGSRTSDEDYGALLTSLKKRPLDYFRMFYADTALFGAQSATRCGLDFFGAARCVFASDCPFDPEGGPMFVRDTIAVIEKLDISDDDRRLIYSDNITSLMRLAPA
jgi:predicted TIM-barrel fold metal-dependent hydrolase